MQSQRRGWEVGRGQSSALTPTTNVERGSRRSCAEGMSDFGAIQIAHLISIENIRRNESFIDTSEERIDSCGSTISHSSADIERSSHTNWIGCHQCGIKYTIDIQSQLCTISGDYCKMPLVICHRKTTCGSIDRGSIWRDKR